MNKLHIAFAFDKNYITQCYVLLTSIFVNNTGSSVELHVIAPDVSAEDQRAIDKYVVDNKGKIRFYDIDKEFVNTFVMHGAGYTHAIYYRLFFPHLLPDHITQLLYIDSDTLVVNDLTPIFKIDIGKYPAAAVTDTEMPVRSELGIDSIEDYFNSGVLLMNLPEWKSQRITEKTIELINDKPELIKNYPDQDALNIILKNNWFKLGLEFNLMKAYVPDDLPKRSFSNFLKDKYIVHFNGLKPWTIYCEHKFRFLYYHYLKLSPKSSEPSYSKIILNKKSLQRVLYVRTLEMYFNYPEVGRIWRWLKRI